MYEDDLSGNGISVEEALAFAETFPLVLRTETGLNGTTVFRFGHLSVQEFLAASYKLEDIKAQKMNLSSCIQHQVDEVLENNEGVSDLLLRFMFGLIKERMLLPPKDLLFGYVKKKILSKISSYSTVVLFHCLRELKFSNLTDKSCPALAAVLSSKESFLRELDLGYNSFSTSGVQELAEGLNSMTCRLKILRLQGCGLTAETCQYLSQCLMQHQILQELDLSSNGIGDRGLKLLSHGLGSSSCRLQTLKLYCCGLTVLSCESIGEALKSETSTLLELNLSNNSLKDAGFKIICEGMYAWCSLQKLKDVKNPGKDFFLIHLLSMNIWPNTLFMFVVFLLSVSRCGITGAGCRYLAKVLCSISQLTDDLDLSMNHIGDKGVKEISPDVFWLTPAPRRASGTLVLSLHSSTIVYYLIF
uniref:NACHT LRR and PYD domain-containing protein n=1 Tax=Pundamilia nyererei TaxID=303518 RepID=A0A3B4FC65_9CICH